VSLIEMWCVKAVLVLEVCGGGGGERISNFFRIY